MSFSTNLQKFEVVGADQKKRYVSFVHELSRDSDRTIFDKRVLKVVSDYARDTGMVERERRFLNKIDYAQSRKESSQLDDQIGLFAEKHVPSVITNPNYQTALSLVSKELGNILQPLNYQQDSDIREALPKRTTHAGFSFILYGLKKKGDYMEGISTKWQDVVTKAIQTGSFNRLICPGTRTQNSSPYDRFGNRKEGDALPKRSKTRLVSMIDLFVIITELIYAKPLQNYLSNVPWYAGGKDPSHLRQRIRTINSYQFWTSIDYSHFDQHIPGWMIRDAFTVLKGAFGNVDDSIWNLIVHDFVNKHFICPDGSVRPAHDGIPSGSMFTQIVGTLCNRIMVLTYLSSRGFTSYDMIAMGDDNVIGTNIPIDMDDLATYFRNMFGAEINSLKSDQGSRSEPIFFLSREWRSGGEWRHPHTLLCKLLYPERFRTYGGEMTPELVVYSYCLAFPLGMRELIDMDRFLNDHAPRDISWMDKNQRNLPGFMKFMLVYNQVDLSSDPETIWRMRLTA